MYHNSRYYCSGSEVWRIGVLNLWLLRARGMGGTKKFMVLHL